MDTTSAFWSGKTVLVAGATGFLGGWLVHRLLTSGAHVVALIRSHKPHSQFFMESLDKQTQVEWGSVDDPRVIERIFDRYPIDNFFHAAYGADVNRVLDEPLECFKSSALSTQHLADFGFSQDEPSKLHLRDQFNRQGIRSPANTLPRRDGP